MSDHEETEEPVVLRVKVLRAGRHNRRLDSWEWLSAPPHVRRFIEGGFASVVLELATLGYTFRVEVLEEDISFLDFASRGGSHG